MVADNERRFMRLLRTFMRNTCGATAVEYGLLAAIMAVALIGGFGTFATALKDTFGAIETKIEQPAP